MNSKKGISLISLIITIIVIIILAAIVIFSGFGATESAQFAKFSQEFSGYQDEVKQRYLSAKVQSSTEKQRKSDSVIYAEIAGATANGAQAISSVLDGKTLSEGLKGTNCYMLSDGRTFYTGDGGTYITDRGEIFTLPGFRYVTNGEERYYVSAGKYYIGDGSTNQGGTSSTGPVLVVGDSEIQIGDYVTYVPDSASYNNNDVPVGKAAKDYYLGHNDVGTLETDATIKWRVIKIGEQGEVLITPEDAVNQESMKLYGAPGYLNSTRVLDYVCGKLYSNSDLAIKARSMRPEDLDYNVSDGTIHYAYYSNSLEGEPQNVEVNGVIYTGKRHEAINPSYEYQDIAFWDYDEGTDAECKKEMELNGYTYSYASPVGNKPVLVTSKNGGITTGLNYNTAKDIIGSSYGWIASQYIKLYEAYADFYVRFACSTDVYGRSEANSHGIAGNRVNGLRPLVTLGSGYQMEASGEVNGITNWEISKVN